MKKQPEVSIILTCFNEGWLMKETLKKIREVMAKTPFSFEVIFVDDASTDNSLRQIKALIKKHSQDSLKLLVNKKNQGRGYSVTCGIKTARGEIVGFIDSDLEIPARYLPAFIKAIRKGVEVVICRRVYDQKILEWPRNFASKLYSFLVKKMLSLPIEDTEAGLKFFKRKSILPILNQVQDKRWFWDTEIITRSFFAGLKIKEIPARVLKRKDKKTTVNLFPDTLIYLKSLYNFKRLYERHCEVWVSSKSEERGGFVKAIQEIGWQKTLRFFFWTIFRILFALAIFPPLRVGLLRLFGAQLGKNVVIAKISLVNLYALGLKNLKIGNNCFLGDGVMLDLAGPITLEKNVTLAFRSMVLTHLNVGYQDHLLQKKFPKIVKGVEIKDNSFIGAGAIILSGTKIGPESFVASGTVVNKDVSGKVVVAGNPAKIIKKLV